MMSNEKQMIVISGFMGFTIGVCVMMFVNIDKEQTINYCLEQEIQEIEFSVCEECWYDVFDGGNEYQFTN
tara:strand:- start:172 stop:381 length:210 start_codon:yes stop_codon:yes gene_type:complete